MLSMKDYLKSRLKRKLLQPLLNCIVILIVFSSCELENNNQAELSQEQKLEQAFSLDAFKNSPAIQKEDLIIDWTSSIERKFDSSIFYEYFITHKNASLLSIEGYVSKASYRLLARFDEDNQPEYFLVELLPSIDNITKDISYLNISGYSGMAYLFDLTGEKIGRESYEDGVLQTKSIGKGVGRSLLPRLPSKCAILEGLEPVGCSGGGGCSTSTVTVRHWEYFYDVSYYQNTGQIIDITYSHRESRGQTIQQVTNCSSSGTPVATHTRTESVKSNPPGILSTEEGEDDQVILFADCSSWEFANQSDGAKACGITGITNIFVGFKRVNGQLSVVTQPITATAPLYFTMPSNWTNGRASTVAALAYDTATKKTEAWFALHPDTSGRDLLDEWKKALVFAFKEAKGSVSGSNKHGVFRTAPFKRSFKPNKCD